MTSPKFTLAWMTDIRCQITCNGEPFSTLKASQQYTRGFIFCMLHFEDGQSFMRVLDVPYFGSFAESNLENVIQWNPLTMKTLSYPDKSLHKKNFSFNIEEEYFAKNSEAIVLSKGNEYIVAAPKTKISIEGAGTETSSITQYCKLDPSFSFKLVVEKETKLSKSLLQKPVFISALMQQNQVEFDKRGREMKSSMVTEFLDQTNKEKLPSTTLLLYSQVPEYEHILDIDIKITCTGTSGTKLTLDLLKEVRSFTRNVALNQSLKRKHCYRLPAGKYLMSADVNLSASKSTSSLNSLPSCKVEIVLDGRKPFLWKPDTPLVIMREDQPVLFYLSLDNIYNSFDVLDFNDTSKDVKQMTIVQFKIMQTYDEGYTVTYNLFCEDQLIFHFQKCLAYFTYIGNLEAIQELGRTCLECSQRKGLFGALGSKMHKNCKGAERMLQIGMIIHEKLSIFLKNNDVVAVQKLLSSKEMAEIQWKSFEFLMDLQDAGKLLQQSNIDSSSTTKTGSKNKLLLV